jgi:hypothetical protein
MPTAEQQRHTVNSVANNPGATSTETTFFSRRRTMKRIALALIVPASLLTASTAWSGIDLSTRGPDPLPITNGYTPSEVTQKLNQAAAWTESTAIDATQSTPNTSNMNLAMLD